MPNPSWCVERGGMNGYGDIALINSVPKLASQMRSGKGEGHFYYAIEGADGKVRRQMLAKKLFDGG